MKLDKYKFEIALISIILAFCSIVYELLLANTLALITGSQIWWQSLTIGIYIGGLGIGAFLSERVTDMYRSLMKVELGLSFLGAIIVPYVYFFHATLKYFENVFFYNTGQFYTSEYVQNMLVVKILFFIIVQLLTFAIGLLSGFEIPLLIKWMKLDRQYESLGENRILGISYIGTLIGTICFSFFLLPKLDIVKTSIVVASLNLLTCIYLTLKNRQFKSWTNYPIIGFTALVILIIGLNNEIITQRYLKFYYYLPRILSNNNLDFDDLINTIDKMDKVERSKSLYQYVDIFQFPYKEEGNTKDTTILTLDTHFQFSTVTEFYYHQAFSHVPIALNSKIPEKVLVLGGGDGLLIRELVKYEGIKSIHHIELDQKMVELANTRFKDLSESSLKNPKVFVEINDGFYYLRNTKNKYDAIFIDFPYPNSYDLSKLYSKEFYKFVFRALSDDGFVVLDTPFFNKINEKKESDYSRDHVNQIFNERHVLSNSIFASTVFYSGFKTIFPYRMAEESFLFLKKDFYSIDFKAFEANSFPYLSKDSLSEIHKIKDQYFPYHISPKYVNSIFKPQIAKKDDF